MAISTDINAALLEDVLAVYTQAEIEMLGKVAKAAAKGVKSDGWNTSKLKQVQSLKDDLQKTLNNTSKLGKAKLSESILKAYTEGLKSAETDKKGTHATVLDDIDIPMNLKMQILATNKLLDNASFQVLRKADDAYSQVMSNATTGLLVGTDTRIDATQKMLNEFASKGITSFTDKAGRNWDLSTYSEMCVRTLTAHAALQGHVDRSIEVGEDLVRVSKLGTTCKLCAKWEGVVLSISGKTPGYISLDAAKAAGLFHPNCKHTLVMHIPELDGPGKMTPNSEEDYEGSYSQERQLLLDTQRANERKIRYWKKRNALAITPDEQMKSQAKIKYWQHTNLLHCEKNNLRRMYAREGVRVGNASGAKGAQICGNLKDYELLYKDVVGSDAKKTFMKFKLDLQHFASSKKEYSKWLKDEIQSLDQLDIDLAQMKDKNNKSITPTSLYKKYIGDNPSQDYAEISNSDKGTSEYKTGYAKWLKEQVEGIGVEYQVKPKYVEVVTKIANEDVGISATEMYKKYHDGKKPTDAYNEQGGESGTGMKYGKWIETQKKDMLSQGIKKTVPFENSVISGKKDTVLKAKEFFENAKVQEYKLHLKSENYGVYTSSQEVKKKAELYENAKPEDKELAKKIYELAMENDIEIIKDKAKNSYSEVKIKEEIANLEAFKKTDTFKSLQPIAKSHVFAKQITYEEELDEITKKKKAVEKVVKENPKGIVKPDAKLSGDTIMFDEKNFTSERKDKAVWCLKREDSYKSFIDEAKEAWQQATKKEKDGIHAYTAGSGHMNRPLRGFKGSWFKEDFKGVGKVSWNSESSKGKANIEGATSYIQKTALKQDTWLQRGVSSEGLKSFLGIEELNGLSQKKLEEALLGKVVVDEAFMSTGSAKGSGFGGAVINIYCPKGTHATYVEPFSAYGNGQGKSWDGVSKQSSVSSENETIIQRGTAFRVSKVSKSSKGLFIDIEVVGQKNFDEK